MNQGKDPIFIDEGNDAPRVGLPFVERNAITAVVYGPNADKYLGLKWKKVDWDTFITGGIEEGQTAEQAARVEVYEESGYKNLKLIKELPRFHSKFYHHPKGENRFAHFQAFLFELENDERDEVSAEEKERHECVWLSKEELLKFRLPDGHKFLLASVLGE